MSMIAVIPARGGSKRVPHKNIRPFCGKPVIRYSIEAALKSGLFDEIMVSTDDETTAAVARQCGARVPFLRSRKNSDDFATTEAVIAEVLDRYRSAGTRFEFYCCLYAAAPFVTAEMLKAAFERMNSRGGSFLTPVAACAFPPQRCRAIRGGRLVMEWPEYANARTQDLEPLYHDCGQFYFGRVDAFLRFGMAGKDVVPLILPEKEAQDIDTESDWALAETKYRLIHSEKAPGGAADETP